MNDYWNKNREICRDELLVWLTRFYRISCLVVSGNIHAANLSFYFRKALFWLPAHCLPFAHRLSVGPFCNRPFYRTFPNSVIKIDRKQWDATSVNLSNKLVPVMSRKMVYCQSASASIWITVWVHTFAFSRPSLFTFMHTRATITDCHHRWNGSPLPLTMDHYQTDISSEGAHIANEELWRFARRHTFLLQQNNTKKNRWEP